MVTVWLMVLPFSSRQQKTSYGRLGSCVHVAMATSDARKDKGRGEFQEAGRQGLEVKGRGMGRASRASLKRQRGVTEWILGCRADKPGQMKRRDVR